MELSGGELAWHVIGTGFNPQHWKKRKETGHQHLVTDGKRASSQESYWHLMADGMGSLCPQQCSYW